MPKSNCKECEYRKPGINYTNCSKKCHYKYTMQRYRSNKDVEKVVCSLYKAVNNYWRDWIKNNFQTSKQIKENQEKMEELSDFVEFIERKLIPYSSVFDFQNLDLIGNKETKDE